MRNRIKKVLKYPGWNKKRLADAVGVSERTVKSWLYESGGTMRNPNKWVLPLLETVLSKAEKENDG